MFGKRFWKYSFFILCFLLIYVQKNELIFFGLKVFNKYDSSKSAYSERLIAERYQMLAHENGQNAANHYKIALEKLKKIHTNTSDKETLHRIEYLIATHYECGKGTKENWKEARAWYQKAKSGNTLGVDELEAINEALKRMDPKN